MSIRRARAAATVSMAPYSPWNQLAVRSGLVVLLTRSPTLPVTQTAASVTHSVTPRMTNSPVAEATLLAAFPTAPQTLLTTGRSHGFGSAACSARAVGVHGPTSISAHRSSASAALAARTDTARSGLATAALVIARDGGEQLAGARQDFCGGPRRGRSIRAPEGADFPRAALPDERDDLGPPRLLGL